MIDPDVPGMTLGMTLYQRGAGFDEHMALTDAIRTLRRDGARFGTHEFVVRLLMEAEHELGRIRRPRPEDLFTVTTAEPFQQRWVDDAITRQDRQNAAARIADGAAATVRREIERLRGQLWPTETARFQTWWDEAAPRRADPVTTRTTWGD